MIKFKNFFENYLSKLHYSISNTNIENLEKASEMIIKTIKNKKKFLFVETVDQQLLQIIIFVII